MPTTTEMMLYPMFSMDNVLYVDEAYSHAVERHNQPKAVKEGPPVAKHGFARANVLLMSNWRR